MNNEYKIILHSDEYFDIIKFDSMSPDDKIAYILYYVTEVAKLRKDMLPEIIADRIADQYKLYQSRAKLDEGEKIVLLSRNSVKEIMENNKEYFVPVTDGVIDKRDRKSKDTAYVLSKKKLQELNDEFDGKIKNKIYKLTFVSRIEKANLIISSLLLIAVVYFFFFNFEDISIIHNDGDNYVISMSERMFMKAVTISSSIITGSLFVGFKIGRWKLFK